MYVQNILSYIPFSVPNFVLISCVSNFVNLLGSMYVHSIDYRTVENNIFSCQLVIFFSASSMYVHNVDYRTVENIFNCQFGNDFFSNLFLIFLNNLFSFFSNKFHVRSIHYRTVENIFSC